MNDDRTALGAAGERVAAAFLQRRGAVVLARNRPVGAGEVDLIVELAGTRLLVEVRSRRSERAPLDAFDDAKAMRLRALSDATGISRVDLVAVGFGRDYVTIHWVPWAV